MAEGQQAEQLGNNISVHTQSVSIPPLPEFNPDSEVGESLGTRWNLWMEDFEMYLLASGITDAKRKRALLLYQAGKRVREIFRQIPDTGTEADYEIAKTKLKEHFEPQQNRRYAVYRFRQAKQEPNETLDQFHTRLRTLAQTCTFNDVDFEVEQQIIMAGSSSRIRKKALRDPTYDLKSILIDGRRDELSAYQARDIESKDPNSNAVNVNKVASKTCRNCGGAWPHEGQCPAKGKQCRKCQKLNHFARVCRGQSRENKPDHVVRHQKKHKTPQLKPVNVETDSNSSDNDYLYTVSTDKSPKVNVKICQHSFKATVDTGASINVIDQETYEKMKGVKLQKTNIKAFAYNSTEPVKFIGKFEETIETRRRVTVATIYVAKTTNGGNLISATTAQELGLISLHLNKVSTTQDHNLDNILNKHAKVFTGLGKLKGDKVKLNIDNNQTPRAQQQRRIPYHIRKKVEHALEQLEQDNIIERVPDNHPTPWVSPIVVVPKKDGGVRICVDMRLPNEAIKRIRHPIPTVEDISFELNGATCFSKLDLSQAYHQLELDEDSRYITTFSTHIGLFRYKRLNYGTNAAAEIFQYTLQTQLQGLTGVKNIADDIIVYGKTREEHDVNLDKCLQRLSDKGLRLNHAKCRFVNETLEFFGQIFSKDGNKPDPKRVEALKNASVPTNVSEVRSLLGMANYSAKYIPNFATITAPLRNLTKKGVSFTWTETHQSAFCQLTTALASTPCMAYFDTQKETLVTVDASPVGVSAILSQRTKGLDDDKIIAYASRALTEVEKRYSQTEKEALAIIYGVEHFHLYLYGHDFTLITDHKPLEIIYGSRKSKPSARIERWVLRLQPYSFKVLYKPGVNNPADYLSRHPTTHSLKQQKMTEEHINFLAYHSVPKAMTLEEIELATNQDDTLKGVRAAIKLNQWQYDIVKPFKAIKDELTVTSKGIVLRGSRIVIPQALQQRAINIAHETHLGLTKTKALIREKIWFPKIDKMVKDTVEKCIACQAVGRSPSQEPLTGTDMPKGPWDTVHIDFYGPMPTGEYLLVAIDRYSRYPEVEVMRSTKASTVIPKLDQIFARHGIPTIVKSDNGPPFNGVEYKHYLEILGIKAQFSTPKWPQGNAEAERFMQPLGKALKTAHIENRPWQQELSRFLLQYRTTPHSSTNVPPAELMFNRTVKGKLPVFKKQNVINRHKTAKENDMVKQKYNKEYADNRRNVKKSNINLGDYVLVRQDKQNKLSANFSKVPYIVTHRSHSRVTARNSNGHIITRNVSQFKQIPKPNVNQYETDDDEPITNNNNNNNQNDNNNQNANNKHHQQHGQQQHDLVQSAVRRSSRIKGKPDRYGQSVYD